MPCFRPWRLPGGDGQILPCGQCRGCRAAHAREWALRCMHEASMHEKNCFITLTYDPENEPPGRSLDREAFPRFMKRLRKEIGSVRYYHVGEYGTARNRPHYHSLLFGFDFPDKEVFSVRKGFRVYTSELLRSTWKAGLSEIGSVTPASAAYLTGYVKRRMTGSWAKAKYGSREPEYGTMSRNPGIGAGWIDKYKCEVYPVDGVVVRGRSVRPPRYYDLRVGDSSPALLDGVRCQRFNRLNKEDCAPERLAAANEIMKAESELYDCGGSL